MIIVALSLKPKHVTFQELYGHFLSHKVLINSFDVGHPPFTNIAAHSQSFQFTKNFLLRPHHSHNNNFFHGAYRSFSKNDCKICGLSNHTTNHCHCHYDNTFASLNANIMIND